MRIADVSDFRLAARRRLPHFLFEYIDGGSYAQQTLRANVEDLQTLTIRQRVMTDVSKIDLTTTMLGRPVSMPVALGPHRPGGLLRPPRRGAGPRAPPRRPACR